MPKGAKKKANKNKHSQQVRRALPELDDGQDYCVVVKTLGNKTFTVRFPDGTERLGMLQGKVRRRQWVTAKNWVIAAARPYEDRKCDISLKLDDQEVGDLVRRGDIFKGIARGIANMGTVDDVDDIGFDMIGADDSDPFGDESGGQIDDEILALI